MAETARLPFDDGLPEAALATVRLYLPPRYFGDGYTVEHPLLGRCIVHGYGPEPYSGLVAVDADAGRWAAVRHLMVLDRPGDALATEGLFEAE